ncbi:hypothetical protein QU481_22260, partial [Crenobacter sp. SG2303]
LYGRLPAWQAMFDAGFEIWLQTYIRPLLQTRSLLALMEFAGEGLISLESSKDWPSFRLTSPRSDLFCHQAHINLRNLSAIHLLKGSLIFYAALAT